MSIVATLIARNEARCITRCLESIRPWVDHLLVVDTGSTDGTPELARQCGAEVHHFAWPDDFSQARNRALELADADWHLILDADEWIEAGGELLRPWCAGPPRLGHLCIHSGFNGAGIGAGHPADRPVSTSRSWITRVIPRGARFRGRVHEQVDAALPHARIEMHLSHDGYLDAQMARKRDRNHPLLLLELEEHPDDAYILYQLGREAEGRHDFAVACILYGRAFGGVDPGVGWFPDLLVRRLHCLGQAGRVGEGLALAESLMQAARESPDFFFVTGNLVLDRAMEDPGHALERWLPLAVSCWERCLEIGERPDLEGSVEGRGSHLARYNLEIVRTQLAQAGWQGPGQAGDCGLARGHG